MLWALTVFGGFYPAIYAASVDLSFDLSKLASQVNSAGLFKDMFYMTVVVALIGICDIVNIMAAKNWQTHSSLVLLYTAALIYFIYIAIVGTGEFARLASHAEARYVVPAPQFSHDYAVLYWTCVIDLCVEGLLAFRGD